MLQLTNIGIQNTWPKRDPVSPSQLGAEIWIDAEDYAVGTFANGAAITNKGNALITFQVVGTTLSIQVNSDGKKEFVFDGNSTIRCTSATNVFNQFKNGTLSYTIGFIGKIGTTSNPDAFYGICGSNATSSTNEGLVIYAENRVASPNKGLRQMISKGIMNSFPIDSLHPNVDYSTRISFYADLDLSLLMDNNRLFYNGDINSIKDRIRTTANTTSGLGTVIAFSGTDSTYPFEIGGTGNGTGKLVGKMEQFMLIDIPITQSQVRGLNKYFAVYPTIGDTTFKYLTQTQTLSDQYVFGGVYFKNASKSRTMFVTSVGPAHSSLNRVLSKTLSTNDGNSFAGSYTTIWSDAAENAHLGVYGGESDSGRWIVCYAKFNDAASFLGLIVRYSDDDGDTWSSEVTVTIPVTSPTLDFIIPHDNLVICNNGDIALTCYGYSGTSLYNIYIMRSTDDGLTWSFALVYTSGSVNINECSAAHLGGNDWIVVARIEVASGGFFEFKQFYSNDDLATFSDDGNTDFNLNYVYAHPPMVRTIFLDGTRVIELSWVNRGTRRWHFKYALPSALITNGATEWDSKPTYTYDIREYGDNQGWETGYPFIIHPDDTLKAEGVFFGETSSTTTDTVFVKIDDELKSKIKTDLGI